jgi:hypothetical protein
MNCDYRFNTSDRRILRDLARMVAEIAADPVMAERRQLWSRHNSLQKVRPMMLVFPEGAWEELIPESSLRCEGERARWVEMRLRQTIYTYEYFQDDTVIEATWLGSEWWNQEFIRDTGWGVEIERQEQPEDRGAFGFKPTIRTSRDLKKLHFPEVIYDEPGHLQAVERMQDLFGDLLEVKRPGSSISPSI